MYVVVDYVVVVRLVDGVVDSVVEVGVKDE